MKQFDGQGEWVQTKKRFKSEGEAKGTGARLGDNPQCEYRLNLEIHTWNLALFLHLIAPRV